MNLNYTKHYYDPFEKLDHKWQQAIATGNLTISHVAKLSGFSRQHIYNLISKGKITAKMLDDKSIIPCKAFVRWFSSQPVTTDTPLGYASYSLQGMMNLTGMTRSWVLIFVERYSISSYYCGVYRRFNKQEAEKAWNQEWFKYAKWISAEDAIDRFNITLTLFYTMVAQHSVSIKHSDGKTLYFKRDIEKELKWRMNHEQSFY